MKPLIYWRSVRTEWSSDDGPMIKEMENLRGCVESTMRYVCGCCCDESVGTGGER